MVDEVTYVVELLKQNWANAISSVSGIAAVHQVTPTIVDVRNLTKNKAVKYDLSNKVAGESSSDLIVVFEDNQDIQYPTIAYDVRNETYSVTLHIRCIDDDRGNGVANFGRDRLRALYQLVRYIVENKRRGATGTLNSDSARFNFLELGGRSESNDRNKRIFGYKVGVTLKRYAIAIP